MPVATPLLRRPAPPTTKPPLVLQLAYGVGYGEKEERGKKDDVGRMRARFTVRHRVMCANEGEERGRERERHGTKKNSGVSREKRRRIENGRNDCLTSPFGLNASHFLGLACFVSCRTR